MLSAKFLVTEIVSQWHNMSQTITAPDCDTGAGASGPMSMVIVSVSAGKYLLSSWYTGHAGHSTSHSLIVCDHHFGHGFKIRFIL